MDNTVGSMSADFCDLKIIDEEKAYRFSKNENL